MLRRLEAVVRVHVVCCMACCNVAGRMLHQVRQLEAVVRIAESLAKMSLAPVATEEHVNEVRCSMLFSVGRICNGRSATACVARCTQAVACTVTRYAVLMCDLSGAGVSAVQNIDARRGDCGT